MTDRDTLLQFIGALYDVSAQARLAESVGVDSRALSGLDAPERAESLLTMVQSLGRAQALISQIEIDYPGQLPVVAWEGARGGNPGRSVHDAIAQRAAQMRAHQNAQPSSGEPKPIQPEEDMADRVVDQATADNLAKLHGPLLGLRDGVDQLEEARRNIERIAVKQADGRATDGGILASELAPDQTIEGHQLPFRFVHGYTLPKHWARRDNEI